MPVRFPSVVYPLQADLPVLQSFSEVDLLHQWVPIRGPFVVIPGWATEVRPPIWWATRKAATLRGWVCAGFLVFVFYKVPGHVSEKRELKRTSEVMYSDLSRKAKKKSLLFSDSHPAFVGTRCNKYIHLSSNKQFWVRQTFGGRTRSTGVGRTDNFEHLSLVHLLRNNLGSRCYNPVLHVKKSRHRAVN